MTNTDCPCGMTKNYTDCCEPFIKGEALPETAEQLMRSRYSAYNKKEVSYIFDTYAPESRPKSSVDIVRWSDTVAWTGLEVLETKYGKSEDSEGIVYFHAHYIKDGASDTLKEKSTFRKEGDRWFYVSGKLVSTAESTKIAGRNDPCPCGSGKKYKKCCIDK
jgi:SEC-C motif-containing protein